MKHVTKIVEVSRTSFARRIWRADCACGWFKVESCRGDLAFDAKNHRRDAAKEESKARAAAMEVA